MKYPETSRRLQYAMDLKGLKAVDLARLSGVSKASISQYINGTHSPGNVSAGKMAEVLCVNPVWLMGFNVLMVEDSDKDSAAKVLIELFTGFDVQRKAEMLSYARYLSERKS